MASSETKKCRQYLVIYLGKVNGNLIWLQGVHQVKCLKRPDLENQPLCVRKGKEYSITTLPFLNVCAHTHTHTHTLTYYIVG